ncbi:MAG: glycoside hydrolase family 27 protein [Polyangiaceae bacterium]
MSTDAGAMQGTLDGFRSWAVTPPLGWNSWDCFGTTITEEQARAQAIAMAKWLLPHGYRYFVIDIQWYEPAPSGHAYRENAPLTLDPFGRLLPAPNRFPSAVPGAGFSPLASFVHELGLKFGVHLMRGIPRLAVERDLPVLGTGFRASDIADKARICPWNPDMYGVDPSRPGAQEYYDSVFSLFASWGVDFVKVDDIARPYHEHERELEIVRRAIDKAGRPMVLSISPGETAITAAEHVQAHANLWRISDDFWDNWISLREQFERLSRWNPHRRPGNFPDADMLPLGVLNLGARRSRFNHDEQITLLSLWAISRSPLIFGGDMTAMDDALLALLTNDEVLEVDQLSTNNRPLFERDGLIGWCADCADGRDLFLALFNARDPFEFSPNTAAFSGTQRSDSALTDALEIEVDLRGADRLVLLADDDSCNAVHHFIVWGEPQLELDSGQWVSLCDIQPESAISWWGDVTVDENIVGKSNAAGLGGDGKGARGAYDFVFGLPSSEERRSVPLSRRIRDHSSSQGR